jgi:hypothetical protein
MRGIDVDAAYPIFMSILKEGVSARPFMYPAYRDARKYLGVEASKQLRRLSKKYSK